MKQPALKFDSGDWLKDTALSKCTTATRGVWIDALCHMHENCRSGVISGTRDQLCRTLRCTIAELTAALAEIEANQVGDVTDSNGLVTLSNRRMKREAKLRSQTKLRVTRHREREACNARIPAGNISPGRGTASRSSHPDLKTVLAWAQMIGCAPGEAERFWNHYEASGWRDRNGNPIVNPRAKLAVWAQDARSRPAEARHHGNDPGAASGGPVPHGGPPSGVSPSVDLMHKQEQLKRVEAAIETLKFKKPDVTQYASREHGEKVLEDWRAKLRTLRAERVQLMTALGFPIV